jgi:HEAT repeat protein
VVAKSAPWVFLVFAMGFAVYRFALVAAKRYSAFKAFFQVAVAAVFFLLLLPGGPVSVGGLSPPASRQSIVGLLADPDPRVRSLAAELARYRPGGPEVAHALVKALDDPDEDVRRVAHETLVQFNSGQDLGPTSEAWGKRFP